MTPTEIRTVIVDDEPLARQRLRRLLAGEQDVRVLAECPGGRQAVDVIQREMPHLVLLDIQMPEVDGFDVVRVIAEAKVSPAPLVVFVTAYDEYALRAFEVNALDYLLKPIDPERLRAALARAREALGHTDGRERDGVLRSLLQFLETSRPGRRSSYADRLMTRGAGRVLFVKTDTIDWIEAAGNYAKVHVGKQFYLVRQTMTRLERALDPSRFSRIHRSTIVNLDRVREMQPWFSGDWLLILEDGTKLRLSRGYKAELEKRMT